MTSAADYWSILIPQARDNLIKNPMAGSASSYSAQGSATVTRVTSPTLFGKDAFRVQTTTTNDGIRFTLSEAMSTSSNYVLTLYQRGYSSVDDLNESPKIATAAANTTAATLHYVYGDWRFTYVLLAGATYGGASSTYIDILEGSATTNDYAIGFVQLEAYPAADQLWSSPIAGELPGCTWLGAPHNSPSRRKQTSYEGGVELFLNHSNAAVPDLGVTVSALSGAGAAPVQNTSHSLALDDGDLQDNQTSQARSMALTINIKTDDLDDWHEKRRKLIRAFKVRNVAAGQKAEAITLRYYGNLAGRSNADEHQIRELRAVYDGGLEMAAVATSDSNQVSHESTEVRLIAYDPNLYGFGEKSAAMTMFAGGSYTKYHVYLPDDGTWGDADDAGTLNTPQGDGTGDDGPHRFMRCAAKNGQLLLGIYYGQDDTTNHLNHARLFHYVDGAWDEKINASSEAFVMSSSPAGTDVNPWASLIFGSEDDQAYISSDGDGTGAGDNNDIYEVILSSETFTALGTANEAARLYVGIDGNLYAYGAFTEIDAVSKDRVAYYDGSSWTEVGTGVTTGEVFSLAQAPNGDLYMSGSFTANDGVQYYDDSASAFVALTADGFDSGYANAILIDDAGTVFLFGTFTATNSENLRRAAYYQGGNLFELGGGLNGTVDGAQWYDTEKTKILVWGSFTATADGNTTIPFKTAIWDGSEWVAWENYRSAAPTDLAYDPITGNTIAVYNQGTGTNYGPGETTVSYQGTALAYPRLRIENTSADPENLNFIGNKTTGAKIYLNYDLQPNEVLTFDFHPGRRSIESSFYGNQWAKISNNSDFGDYYLIANGFDTTQANIIQARAVTSSVKGFVIYRDTWDGVD